MAAVGGSIESITLDNRVFSVASDADVTRKLGGYENEVPSNGDGTSRLIKTRVSWMLSGITVSIDDDREDHEFLQVLADDVDFFSVTISYSSGIVYQGSGQLSGEVGYSNSGATASIDLSGTGVLTQQ